MRSFTVKEKQQGAKVKRKFSDKRHGTISLTKILQRWETDNAGARCWGSQDKEQPVSARSKGPFTAQGRRSTFWAQKVACRENLLITFIFLIKVSFYQIILPESEYGEGDRAGLRR